jgi:hypothetical protein
LFDALALSFARRSAPRSFDPEGTRPFLGALLLAYYDPDGRLIYAGRAGAGIGHAELEQLWHRLQPLATPRMPLDKPPPRDSRFGSPLTLSRVHWVRPELVAEVKYLTWTEDNVLRQVVYEGLREDKPPAAVRRPIPHPQPASRILARPPGAAQRPALSRGLHQEASPVSKSGLLRRVGRIALYSLIGFIIGSIVLVALYRVLPPPGTPLMLLRLVEGYGIDKSWRRLDDISPHLIRAAMAGEDARFCRHLGFD